MRRKAGKGTSNGAMPDSLARFDIGEWFEPDEPVEVWPIPGTRRPELLWAARAARAIRRYLDARRQWQADSPVTTMEEPDGTTRSHA